MSVTPHNDHSGSGVPPLNQENKQSRDSSATLRSPNGAKECSPGQGAQRRRPGSRIPKHVEP